MTVPVSSRPALPSPDPGFDPGFDPGVDPGVRSSSRLFAGSLVVLIAGILVLDLMLPPSAPMWGLYVVPLILASRLAYPRMSLYLAALCSMLVVIEFLWVGPEARTMPGILNRLLGMSVFWIIGFLIEQRRITETDTFLRDQKYRMAIESTPDGFWRVNNEGEIIDVNENYSRLSGYRVEELLQMRVTDLDVNYDEQGVSARTRIIREQGKHRFITSHRKKDGTIWPVEVTATSLADQPFVVAFLRDMTEQRRVEEELRAQRLQLETLIEHAPDAIVVFDIDTMKFTMVNRNAEQLFGLDRSQLLQMGPDELSPPTQPNGRPSGEMAMEKLNTALEKGEIAFEWMHRHSDGRVFPCEVRLLRYPDRQRRVVRGSLQDITERKQAENALRESERRLQEAQRIGKIGHWELNHDTRELKWSSTIHQIIDVPISQSMDSYNALLERIHSEDRDAFDRAFRNSMRLRRPFAIEYRVLAQDGTIKHVHEECETTFDPQGKPVRTLGTMQDITDRKKDEIALARMNEELERRVLNRTAELTRLTAILDASPDFIVITNDPTKEVAYVNQAMRRLAQACGKGTSDLNFADFHPESSIRKLREEGVPTALRTGSWIGETEVIGPNGSLIQVSQLILAHQDADGKTQYLSTVMRDISKLKKVELTLRDREDRLKAILSALPDLIFLVDRDTIFRESYCRDPELLLFPPDVFLGKRMAEVLPENLANQFIRATEAAHEDRSVQILEYPLQLKTRKSWFESRFVACGPKSSLVVVRDITRQKQAAEEMSLANANLAQAARMKDEFLANMSHELRTPLNGILAFTEAVLEEIYGPLTPKQRAALVDIEGCGRHLLALINDILDLAKFEAGKIALDVSETVPSEIAQSSLNFIKQLAHNKKISSQLMVQASTFSADPRRLKQILVNLLSNAIKFTPEGGQIGLEIRGNRDEGKIHFTVWDTGIGIKPEDIGSLFQPFHQVDSKLSREYGGTGLGLSLVQRLANLHGGTVSVDSRAGGGSRFTVTLPYAPVAS